jgi:hypothetical protein
MPRLAVHVVVADYAKWRESFNKGAEARAKYGVTNATVYRNADNGNEVVVVSDVTDVQHSLGRRLR